MLHANDHLLFLSGIISESDYLDRVLHEEITDAVTAPEAKMLLQQLSKRIGDKKMNAYTPVLNVIKNNKNLLEVFTRLLTTLATLNPSQAKTRFGSNFMNQNTGSAVRAGGRKLSNKLDDPDLALLTNYFANKRPELREMFENLIREVMNAKSSVVKNVVDRFNKKNEPVAENVEHALNETSYDSTGAKYTPEQMAEKYEEYTRDIQRVWNFIQAQSVSLNRPELKQIFSDFIAKLKSAGFTGA